MTAFSQLGVLQHAVTSRLDIRRCTVVLHACARVRDAARVTYQLDHLWTRTHVASVDIWKDMVETSQGLTLLVDKCNSFY